MCYYREMLQCDNCKKIYRSDYFPTIHSCKLGSMVCGKCGCRNRFISIVAKPKLFGLLGWRIKK